MASARAALYLAPHYDAALELPGELSARGIAADEVKRLTTALGIVVVARSIPRRLGPDAMGVDLALDKKRCRRVAHALQQAVAQWGSGRKILPTIGDEEKILGAQLNWDPWREAHEAEVNTRMRLAVTWAVRSGKERWGKTALVSYQNELRWLAYALRD